MGVSENVGKTPKPNGFADHYPVLKNGYFIGNINPTFSDKPLCLFALCLEKNLNTSQVGYWNFVTYENDEGPAVPADFEHFKAASSGAQTGLFRSCTRHVLSQ